MISKYAIEAYRNPEKIFGLKLNSSENLMPSCRRCNHYKREQDLEGFRILMKTLHERLRSQYTIKVAINYGIVTIKPFGGKFFFEEEANTNG